jgi:GH24 family phage-related lysozyme (muramidase)
MPLKDPGNLYGAIQKHEGMATKAYIDWTKDSAGNKVNSGYAIGYGQHTNPVTGQPVQPGDTLTSEQAQSLLPGAVAPFAATVERQLGSDTFNNLSANQQNALVDMAYNYGSVPKDMVAAVKSGDNDAIAAVFDKRSGDNSGINANRRQDEKNSFLNDQPLTGGKPGDAAAPSVPGGAPGAPGAGGGGGAGCMAAGIMGIASIAAGGMLGGLGSALNGALGGAISGITGGLSGALSGALGSITGALGGAFSGITGALGGAFSGITGAMSGIMGSISGAMGSITGALGNALGGITGGLSGILNGTLQGAISGGISGLMNGQGLSGIMNGAMGGLTNGISSAIGGALNTITGGISGGIMGSLSSLGSNILPSLTGVLPGSISNMLGGVLQGAVGGVMGTLSNVLKNPLGLPNAAQQFAASGGLVGTISAVAGNMLGSTTGSSSPGFMNVVQMAAGAASQANQVVGAVSEGMSQTFGNGVGGIGVNYRNMNDMLSYGVTSMSRDVGTLSANFISNGDFSTTNLTRLNAPGNIAAQIINAGLGKSTGLMPKLIAAKVPIMDIDNPKYDATVLKILSTIKSPDAVNAVKTTFNCTIPLDDLGQITDITHMMPQTVKNGGYKSFDELGTHMISLGMTAAETFQAIGNILQKIDPGIDLNHYSQLDKPFHTPTGDMLLSLFGYGGGTLGEITMVDFIGTPAGYVHTDALQRIIDVNNYLNTLPQGQELLRRVDILKNLIDGKYTIPGSPIEQHEGGGGTGGEGGGNSGSSDGGSDGGGE